MEDSLSSCQIPMWPRVFFCHDSCTSVACLAIQPMQLTSQLLSGILLCSLVHQRLEGHPIHQVATPCQVVMTPILKREDSHYTVPTKDTPLPACPRSHVLSSTAEGMQLPPQQGSTPIIPYFMGKGSCIRTVPMDSFTDQLQLYASAPRGHAVILSKLIFGTVMSLLGTKGLGSFF